MTKKELAEKLNGRQYGDSFEDVLASDDLMEFA